MGSATRRASSARRSTVRPAASSPTFDLTKACADWRAACATYDAASERYSAICTEMESAARTAAAKHSKRLNAVYKEEDKLAVVIDERDKAASAILAVPVSFEALQLKLSLFRHHWAKERGVDEPLNGGDLSEVASGIVLDLLTLLSRGEAAELASAA